MIEENRIFWENCLKLSEDMTSKAGYCYILLLIFIGTKRDTPFSSSDLLILAKISKNTINRTLKVICEKGIIKPLKRGVFFHSYDLKEDSFLSAKTLEKVNLLNLKSSVYYLVILRLYGKDLEYSKRELNLDLKRYKQEIMKLKDLLYQP